MAQALHDTPSKNSPATQETVGAEVGIDDGQGRGTDVGKSVGYSLAAVVVALSAVRSEQLQLDCKAIVKDPSATVS